MPPKSQSRSGRAEAVEPSRRSIRISQIVEEKQAQLEKPAQETTSARTVREQTSAPSHPKPRQGKAQQKRDSPVNIPARRSIESRKGKSSKKTREATPIAVVGGEEAIGLRNYSAAQTTTNAAPERLQSATPAVDPSERSDVLPEIVEFYHSRGYEVPDEAAMAAPDNDGMAPSQISSRKSKKLDGYGVNYVNWRYSAVLKEHNVSDTPTKDPEIGTYRKLIFNGDFKKSGSMTAVDKEIHRREDALWEIDMLKCATSNEARFQRTIMMTILNRQVLDDKLEFVCEAQWISKRLPGARCDPANCKITRPKPDLAVAFRSESLLPTDLYMTDFDRLKEFQGEIFPEGFQVSTQERAFHFFSMEVKGKRGEIDNHQAYHQNLNTASQALFNIYCCMKEVKDLDVYFKKVRVFSVVATVHGLWVRIHRPVKLKAESCADPEYPVGFQFDELGFLSGTYSREQASEVVYNLLCRCGIMKLHTILKGTIKKLLRRRQRNKPHQSLEDIRQAAASQELPAEKIPRPAPQSTTGRKRRAEDAGGSFASNTSNYRRKFDGININDPRRI